MAKDKLIGRLGPGAALGADDLQWILYEARQGGTGWRAVSFVRTTKDILLRNVAEKRLGVDTAGHTLLASLPATFDEWRCNQTSGDTASSHVQQ